MGSGRVFRGEVSVAQVHFYDPSTANGRGPGAPLPPAPGAHSLHAGARAWADLPAPLCCVPRGSVGRGPRGGPGAWTDSGLEKTKAPGWRKGRGRPASFRAGQSAAGFSRLFRGRAAPLHRAAWPPLRLPTPVSPPRVGARCKPQTRGPVDKFGEQREGGLGLGDPALASRTAENAELGTSWGRLKAEENGGGAPHRAHREVPGSRAGWCPLLTSPGTKHARGAHTYVHASETHEIK